MTTIPEFEEMAFVDWDAAAPPSGHTLDPMITQDIGGPVTSAIDPNLDLVFSNVDGDDFSFWALEHFDANRAPTDLTADLNADLASTDFMAAPLNICVSSGIKYFINLTSVKLRFKFICKFLT